MPETNRIEHKQELTGDLEKEVVALPFPIIFYEWPFLLLKWITLRIPPKLPPQVDKLIEALEGEESRDKIQDKLGLSDRKYFRENYLNPAFEAELIEYTIPEKPNSSNQKYRLTELGKAYKKKLDK